MDEKLISPDYVFEVSWEICNKVGGINTVIATKAANLIQKYGDKVIMVGPDVWREPGANHAFTEDTALFAGWRKRAAKDGIALRIGRWNIIGNPIAVLVDFSNMIPKKDQIFGEFWDEFKLDSIAGHHDYIESAVFGYVTGQVIESFFNYNLTFNEKCVAHFHEWMTGAGLLYLKSRAPHIATLFTTHATVVGRSLAGNGFPLYRELTSYHGDTKAKEIGVVAKQSMEKQAALNSDCFTTVSEITATECKQFLERDVDVVTPNGFEDSFVPKGKDYTKIVAESRAKMKQVAEVVLNHELPDDTMFIVNSGRYEYKNKGIDLFVDAMGDLNRRTDNKKTAVAFIMVPANNYGPRKDIVAKLAGHSDTQSEGGYTTHYLHHAEYDQILNAILGSGIQNTPDEKVKIIFVPSYLDGNDGVFDMKYYDLLIGMDVSVFPSYYEPWGYTPLESLAFSVPTITTNHAGIGMWVNREMAHLNRGIDVLERTVGHDQSIVDSIVDRLMECGTMSAIEKKQAKDEAYEISKIALWDNLIDNYFTAFDVALKKREARTLLFPSVYSSPTRVKSEKKYKSNMPIWKPIVIKANLPQKLKGLEEIAQNIWWSWNFDAIELFRVINPELWRITEKNPIIFLKKVSFTRFAELENDKSFIAKYEEVLSSFKAYLAAKVTKGKPKIGYFSMEYGLNDNLKIYSGGLGILAGDYLKEASDSDYNMVAIGLLYRNGYFVQKLSLNGDQMVHHEAQNFDNLPIELERDAQGNQLKIQVALPGRMVHARIWRADVGRVPLYLIDTDIDENSKEDRDLTQMLYGGNNEHRLKQEMLLGIGGVRVMNALNVEPDLFHCNEGHAALLGLERLNKFINTKNYTFSESLEIVRASTLFTTHTPVPAGHDAFEEDLMMMYMGHYPERLKVSWDDFMNMGRMRPGNATEKFSMSHLAANVSQEINGVSMLHGEVTKIMFNKMWDGYFPQELHIGYVTNGVHYQTWTAKDWRVLYEKNFGEDFTKNRADKEIWAKIYDVPDDEVWAIKNLRRKKLMDFVKNRISTNWFNRHVNPKKIVKVTQNLRDDVLTIGFARRFATYKRAHLLFMDLERLSRIVNHPTNPVHFVFAGKAHPHDGGGQALIKTIFEISQRPEFLGKVIFLENYDIELAKKLVKGVDVWLNTPTRPLEASGTSGMKAVMNGVLNLSVLDGWWVEGYRENAGWALPEERTYENQDFQNELDAETLYNIIETEVTPTFYDRNEEGIPVKWVQYIKKCIAEIAPEFTTTRMITDYNERFYKKMTARYAEIRENDYALAKELSAWKRKVTYYWDTVKVLEMDMSDPSGTLLLGESYTAKIMLDVGVLKDVDFGVEFLVTEHDENGNIEIIESVEATISEKAGSTVTYELEYPPETPGNYRYGIRVFPKHEKLPHRQDFAFVRWI